MAKTSLEEPKFTVPEDTKIPKKKSSKVGDIIRAIIIIGVLGGMVAILLIGIFGGGR